MIVLQKDRNYIEKFCDENRIFQELQKIMNNIRIVSPGQALLEDKDLPELDE